MNTDTHFSNHTNEWYTPPEIIESVLTVLGHIDLDPCSPENPTIPAKMYYTQWSDGLSQIWCGNIYMNPPYGREISKWVDHLIREYWADRVDQAIALVPARIDTKWFNALSDYPWCVVRGRLKFSGHTTGAPFPLAIFYLGDCEEKFVEEFSKWGRIFEEVTA
jgi:DNA N-6-adenine-methyltransferase (Dam).